MSNLFTTAGSKIYIGTAPKSFGAMDMVPSDFASVTWVEISGVTDLGSSGDAAEVVTSNHINRRRTRKAKGTRDAGNMTVVADLDYADPGQLAAIAAEQTDFTYPFKIVLKDAPPGGTPSERLFVALVASQREEWSDANNIMKLNLELAIDSNIARVAAEA
jgi:hypothetical protein